jgi:hypothetical protein
VGVTAAGKDMPTQKQKITNRKKRRGEKKDSSD